MLTCGTTLHDIAGVAHHLGREPIRRFVVVSPVQLVDQCIRHFWDWALIGTKNFGSWGWDMWDLSNQYVGTADTVGLIPFIAFLAILVYGFKYVGTARKTCESDRKQELFVWAIGASLFANVVAYMGIGYLDQIIVPGTRFWL